MPKKKYVNPEEHCIVCGVQGVDEHHIKTRGSGGKDEPWNVVYLCHPHHQELHYIGEIRFAEENYAFEKFLKDNNWEVCPIRNKYFHVKGDV